ncbi:hypothetical protein ISS03_02405 [Patescibacteria group bacterium]|nr:hypothetical protein [Patescibacteria group bacterium]
MDILKRKDSSNIAKYTFLYFISLLSLVFSVMAVGNIVFQLINKHVIDIINVYGSMYSPDALKFALSSLIISAPVYYASVISIHKSLFSGKLDKDAAVRRWLTYFIIFVCGVVVIGWLIAIVYSILDGDLTWKFSLKTLTVIVIAATVGSYYFRDIKKEKVEKVKDNVAKIYLYATLVALLVVFVSGILFVESPRQTRLRKLDNLTIEKFERIGNSLNEYYNNNNRLPVKLEDLAVGVIYLGDLDIRSVDAGKIFEYRAFEGEEYKICAKFNLSNREELGSNRDFISDVWPHGAEYTCFIKNINKYGREINRFIDEQAVTTPIIVEEAIVK